MLVPAGLVAENPFSGAKMATSLTRLLAAMTSTMLRWSQVTEFWLAITPTRLPARVEILFHQNVQTGFNAGRKKRGVNRQGK
jgi:hypothetical protein